MPKIVIELNEAYSHNIVSLAREIRQYLSRAQRPGWEISLPDTETTLEQWAWITSDDAPLPEGFIDWGDTPGRPGESGR